MNREFIYHVIEILTANLNVEFKFNPKYATKKNKYFLKNVLKAEKWYLKKIQVKDLRSLILSTKRLKNALSK